MPKDIAEGVDGVLIAVGGGELENGKIHLKSVNLRQMARGNKSSADGSTWDG